MHIAICDDNPKDRKLIARAIEEYASAQHLNIRMDQFSDAEEMIRAARTERFSLYFLDVMMPCMDGITAAQEIRSFDTEARIVFLTSFREYAYQGFRVKAHDYLLKPLKNDELYAILDHLQALEDNSRESICVQSGRSVFRIPFVRLGYLEVNQKKLYFHMTDGETRQIPGAMADFEHELLARPEFVKIHRSYIVNLNQIHVFSPDGCIMFSGENLPVSRLLFNQVRERYMEHLFFNTGV